LSSTGPALAALLAALLSLEPEGIHQPAATHADDLREHPSGLPADRIWRRPAPPSGHLEGCLAGRRAADLLVPLSGSSVRHDLRRGLLAAAPRCPAPVAASRCRRDVRAAAGRLAHLPEDRLGRPQ